MQTISFKYTKELRRNPYMGFTSFQHFNDEALYSDVIVRPENHMTETENLECYPIPADVPQHGRKEGFYPEADIAYFRVLWKEIEPRQGEYCFEIIEDLLSKARLHHQRILFRLLPHSTRARDDVPDWLRQLIPCPERPQGKRVKDSPADPLFLTLFGNAIRMIGERFDADPLFYAIDICLPGAWGEGHKLENYTEEDLRKLIDTFAESFPNTHLIAQIGLPWLVNYLNEKRPVGWRGDGCGNPDHLNIIYPQKISSLSLDLWKRAPVSFEAYWWLSEWKRQGWNIDKIIEATLGWHVSCFNAKSVPIPYEWKDKVEYWLDHMGYHLHLSSITMPESVHIGDSFRMTVSVQNLGVAPLYEDIPLVLCIKNKYCSHTFITDVKPIKWLPGTTTSEIRINLPAEIKPGHYDLELGIPTPDGGAICFCSDIPFDEPYYKIGLLNILP